MPRRLNIALVGPGLVGTAFIRQLASLPPRPVQLCLVALVRSNAAILAKDINALDPMSSLSSLDSSASSVSPAALASFLSSLPDPAILVDATASDTLPQAYHLFLARGIHIATPNKRAFASSAALYAQIHEAATLGNANLFHESTVGAALPVISTLHDLIDTGDSVLRIDGIFSGTLSYIFNHFSPATHSSALSFSQIVTQAKQLGYTEPDPRDDLNGIDVARKLVILSRILGLNVDSTSSFPVNSLVPKSLESATLDDFLEKLPDHDSYFEKIRTDAQQNDMVVRYVGSINVATGELKVALDSFPKSHPFAALQSSDNLISFWTKRYGDRPLIIQGAGAGADVTAMGVLADVIRASREIIQNT
ncbi:Homoserine dehydrogenase [Neolecta irregularis DAH-3]|uniref:Homoserine dehydrogenase n=1 Tax=Neolecta irregularis (strain DAH-3) TaxID=1198029 RepID=A0A1U7LG93_NEOID|nr:Homoserine dehydrogenase [Neolecta irregularis DAH-3]|eukprot:OLL21675.1 Homoserine dehydrogenase [Neolecta irregularis DAH-3]